jgi:hypothetical protein
MRTLLHSLSNGFATIEVKERIEVPQQNLVLLCYKMCTFIPISLALALIMPYVEVDEPPPDVFLAPA